MSGASSSTNCEPMETSSIEIDSTSGSWHGMMVVVRVRETSPKAGMLRTRARVESALNVLRAKGVGAGQGR